MRLIIYIFILINLIFSQSKIIDIPIEFQNNDFQASKLFINSTGIYFLDTDNRQISFIGNDKKVIYSGGYGTTNEAFIDPIDIISSKLKVWVVDGTENKLISFDHKLNYLNTVKFDDIYPTLCGIDDWGNILLYSEQNNIIYKVDNYELGLSEFIDLSIYNISDEIINELYIAQNGSLGLLTKRSLYIFNRLGRLLLSLPMAEEYKFIYEQSDRWYAVDMSNKIVDLVSREEFALPFDNEISDIYKINNYLYFLLSNQIWVVDGALE